MKVAVTSTGSEPTSEVDSRCGRAPWFLFYDTETRSWEAVANKDNAATPHGAGIQTAENVVRLDAEAVITGHCGPKAYQVLSAAKIKVFLGDARTVEEALRAFESGQLHELKQANGPGA